LAAIHCCPGRVLFERPFIYAFMDCCFVLAAQDHAAR
jgi:hypothetical protein